MPEFDRTFKGGNSESRDSDRGNSESRDSDGGNSENRDTQGRDSEGRENPLWDSPQTEIPKPGIPKSRIPKTGISKTGRFTAPLIQTPLRLPLKFGSGTLVLAQTLYHLCCATLVALHCVASFALRFRSVARESRYTRALLKGTNPRGQTSICGFLRAPAKISGFLLKSAFPKCFVF